jgi:hypothetical protein
LGAADDVARDAARGERDGVREAVPAEAAVRDDAEARRPRR